MFGVSMATEGVRKRLALFCRFTGQSREDAFDLIERRGPRKKGLAGEHLAQDTAHAPQIHALRVVTAGQQDFRRPVPTCRHVFRERRLLLLLMLQGCLLSVCLRSRCE